MLFQRSKKKFLSALMALAIFGAGILVVFHHHEAEARNQEHCATCHLGHSVKAGDIGDPTGEIPLPNSYVRDLAIDSGEVPVFSLLFLGKLSQAPPQA